MQGNNGRSWVFKQGNFAGEFNSTTSITTGQMATVVLITFIIAVQVTAVILIRR